MGMSFSSMVGKMAAFFFELFCIEAEVSIVTVVGKEVDVVDDVEHLLGEVSDVWLLFVYEVKDLFSVDVYLADVGYLASYFLSVYEVVFLEDVFSEVFYCVFNFP